MTPHEMGNAIRIGRGDRQTQRILTTSAVRNTTDYWTNSSIKETRHITAMLDLNAISLVNSIRFDPSDFTSS